MLQDTVVKRAKEIGMKPGKVAAITMAWNSPVLLRKWVEHNAAAYGRQNLFVISHGEDEAQAKAAAGTNFITLPREFNAEFDFARWRFLSGYASGLLEYYNVVQVNDVDELIVLDPRVGDDRLDYMLSLAGGGHVAPVGYDILPLDHDRNDLGTLDWSRPIAGQAGFAVLRARFCKPCILTSPVTMMPGGHSLEGARFKVDPALMLAHLKLIDQDLWTQHYDKLGGDARTAARRARMSDARVPRGVKGFGRGSEQVKAHIDAGLSRRDDLQAQPGDPAALMNSLLEEIHGGWRVEPRDEDEVIIRIPERYMQLF
jgi:hypothetical protein